MAFSSDEFTRIPRTLGRYVGVLYRALLGREPAAAEESAWGDYLVGHLAAVGGRPAELLEFEARVRGFFPPR